MVQAQVKDAFGVGSLFDQCKGYLLENRGFAHSPRPGEQNRPMKVPVFQITSTGRKGKTLKFRDEKGSRTPPGVKAVEYADDFRAV